MKTGSTYALNVQDVNIECDFRTASTQPATVITNTCLISSGVAYGDVNVMGQYAYPGYFSGDDDATGWGNTHPDPSPYAQHLGQYWLPSMTWTASFQFDLKFWLGSETSYAAAAAAGEKVADTGWFTAGSLDSPNDNTFEYMPSVVLQQRLPGDANFDGQVDINDLTIVLSNFGKTAGASWTTGDFVGDGRVDINDLTIVLSHFGQSLGSSVAGNVSAVPEPSVLLLTAIGLVGLVGLPAYAWRKRK